MNPRGPRIFNEPLPVQQVGPSAGEARRLKVCVGIGSSLWGKLWRRSRHLLRAGNAQARGRLHALATPLRQRNPLRPHLGNLYQHAPKPLVLPRSYARAIALVDPPRISLVTPSFNQGRFIEQTLQSVLQQQYPDLEYIVQDGGSTDETVAVLKCYQDQLHRWKSEPDRGQSEAINRGFAGSTGSIMAWLNSDDLLLPGALARVAQIFQRYPQVDVVYGQRVIIDEHGREVGRWIVPRHDDHVLQWADFVPQETLFWRRRLWERVGGQVNEQFQFAMDWELLLRFQAAGARMLCLPRFLGAFRVHDEQKTRTQIDSRGLYEMNLLRRRVLGRVPDSMEIRRELLSFMLAHGLAHVRFRCFPY